MFRLALAASFGPGQALGISGVGLLVLRFVPGDDRVVQPPAVGVGRFQDVDGRAAQARLQERLSQRHVRVQRTAFGDPIEPDRGRARITAALTRLAAGQRQSIQPAWPSSAAKPANQGTAAISQTTKKLNIGRKP